MIDDLILHDGDRWGTAAQIAARLGPDVTPAMIRNWATRDGLPKARMHDAHGRPQVRYPLAKAIDIEATKYLSKRGRPRRLDAAQPTAA
ncbi:hypothetical protein [Micromonospora haikouensis]|uniref:hypothetical protein n=1 Tax=Micromonospora haikouensis TaxID=686309 RepID=UPI003D738BCF